MWKPALHDFLELPLGSQQLNRSICRLCQLRAQRRAGLPRGIEKRGEHDDGGGVLVIV